MANAPWAARSWHTTVVDAAGAIYVIGGLSFRTGEGTIYLNDVWGSIDGGARPDSVGGYSRGYYRGEYSSGVLRVLRGTKG